MTMKIWLKRPGILWLIFLAALVLSLPSLVRRVLWESENRTSVIVADMSYLSSMAGTADRKASLTAMLASGVSGFMIPEYIGREVALGALPGVTLGDETSLPSEVRQAVGTMTGATLTLKAPCDVTASLRYLRLRFPGGLAVEAGSTAYFVLPVVRAAADGIGIMPNLSIMTWLDRQGVPMIYRPAPEESGTVEPLLHCLSDLVTSMPRIKMLAPAGDVAAGYPGSAALGRFVKEHGLLMAQVEFSTQVGAEAGLWASWPNIASLHSVTDEEVVTRKIDRETMLERFFRAANERSVKVLVLRPDVLRGLAQTLQSYCADAKRLRASLDAAGIRPLWPTAAPAYGPSLWAALGLGLLLAGLLGRQGERWGAFDLTEGRHSVFLVAGGLILGCAVFFLGPVARLAGGLTTGLLAAEASLLAMDHWKAPLRGLLLALLFTLVGGLAVASFYSTAPYMWRMVTFSGVKLTLMLPLAVVLLLDLKTGEHPETLNQVLSRAPLWSELLLAGLALLAALVVVVRSGNTTFVPGIERTVRQWLESALVVRPRNKELWVGYPALVIWYFLRRHDLWGHFREILRLAVTLAFSSAVNSFCHFHTPLWMTLLRDLNGWWLGLLVGLIFLSIGRLFFHWGGHWKGDHRGEPV